MKEVKLPTHVGIIMDGNGRWAKKRNKSRSYGHKCGFENLRKLTKHIFKKNIKYLSIFAFSTENFKRSKEEVDYIMNLFLTAFKKFQKELNKEGVKIIFSGREKPFSDEVIEEMKRIEKNTENNTNATLNVCFNYGGRAEIVDASKKIAKDVMDKKLDVESIDEEIFSKYLYQDLPPMDLLIRTGGDFRISNFMLYNLAYAELYFTDLYFPDFDEKEFDKALDSFSNRDRRFGGIKE